MKKLTKRQNKILYNEMMFNDLLYIKFQHMIHEVRQEYKRLISDRKRIKQVILTSNDGIQHRCRITDVLTTPDGTSIMVKL